MMRSAPVLLAAGVLCGTVAPAGARYTHLPNGLGDGREGGIRGNLIPLLLGVRF